DVFRGQRCELLPAPPLRLVDLTFDGKGPLVDVDARRRPGRKDGPVGHDVLPGGDARAVGGVATLAPEPPRDEPHPGAIVALFQMARIRLFLGLCSTSASPSASRSGGMYMPNRPRSPFFRPSHPPPGFWGERPHASTVPSAAASCSSALPSGIQS